MSYLDINIRPKGQVKPIIYVYSQINIYNEFIIWYKVNLSILKT